MIDHGRTGYLFTPGDKTDLCRQTRGLFDHADLGRQMGEAGRRHVAECFSMSAMIEGIAKVYEDGPAIR